MNADENYSKSNPLSLEDLLDLANCTRVRG